MTPAGAVRRTVTVNNPLGLHLRPAAAVARSAQAFAAVVTVWHGEKCADAKSPMALLKLVAVPGAELVVEVDGADADAAAEAVCALLAGAGDGE